MGDTKDSAAYKFPILDLAEIDDQHFKVYMSKSMKNAIKRYARREGISDSEAGRRMFLLAFKDSSVFGGYQEINSLHSALVDHR